MTATRPEDRRDVVLVGGGLASLRAIEALRRDGFDGSITLVTDEPRLPYDRPPLSKEVLTGKRTVASTEYRPAAFDAEHRVDVLHEPATELRPDARQLVTS
ncbi:MAG: FAD-dependent oxidoreductase [Solirubrobacterales bacterium]